MSALAERVVQRLTVDPRARAAPVLVDDHPLLGPLASRHFASPNALRVLGSAAAVVLGALLCLHGVVVLALTREVATSLWLGPCLALGGVFVWRTERDEACQALGLYRNGFAYVTASQTFELLWSQVTQVQARTESGTLTLTVTTPGGRELHITDRVQALGSVVSVFQNRG
ncbi:MAG: hypothetical protein KC593_03580 [Myxococcales bacterium]|nr:hypothetical protein [Myxococcales bacterium]